MDHLDSYRQKKNAETQERQALAERERMRREGAPSERVVMGHLDPTNPQRVLPANDE